MFDPAGSHGEYEDTLPCFTLKAISVCSSRPDCDSGNTCG